MIEILENDKDISHNIMAVRKSMIIFYDLINASKHLNLAGVQIVSLIFLTTYK